MTAEISAQAVSRTVSRGILFLVAAMPLLAVAVYAAAGPAAAIAASGLYTTALGLTILAERKTAAPSRDATTGLPDRAAALARLDAIQSQQLLASSQAAVVVIAVEGASSGTVDPELGQPSSVFVVAARLAQGLRRGDQIMRAGDNSLVAILGPSRGLTARAAESILTRIKAMFREPLRVGGTGLKVQVALGACLQHDAPRADAASWLEAAELAAVVAGETGEPSLFPSGATRVDRSAWIAPAAAVPQIENVAEPGRWRTVA